MGYDSVITMTRMRLEIKGKGIIFCRYSFSGRREFYCRREVHCSMLPW